MPVECFEKFIFLTKFFIFGIHTPWNNLATRNLYLILQLTTNNCNTLFANIKSHSQKDL